jgi:hypothetical protein
LVLFVNISDMKSSQMQFFGFSGLHRQIQQNLLFVK